MIAPIVLDGLTLCAAIPVGAHELGPIRTGAQCGRSEAEKQASPVVFHAGKHDTIMLGSFDHRQAKTLEKCSSCFKGYQNATGPDGIRAPFSHAFPMG